MALFNTMYNRSGADVFGVVWDYSNPSTALTRLTPETDPYGYVNKTVDSEPVPAIGETQGSSPFDGFMPWGGMEEYNIVNRNVAYKRGDPQFSRTNYDTVVLIPVFYYCVIDDSPNSKRYWYVSNIPKIGFEKHPGSGTYIGRYKTGAGYVSKSGLAPLVNVTRATSRNGAKGKGSGWYLQDYMTWCAWALLYLVEFADWNSQAKIGLGLVNTGGALNSGTTDAMVYHTGRTVGTDGETAVQYRHIENGWGNVREWVDGVNTSNREVYISLVRAQYADGDTSNYIDTGFKTPSTNGYIKSIAFSKTFPFAFIPSEAGGSESEFVTDCVLQSSSGTVLCNSGQWGLGQQSGAFMFDIHYNASTTYPYIGSRLIYNP